MLFSAVWVPRGLGPSPYRARETEMSIPRRHDSLRDTSCWVFGDSSAAEDSGISGNHHRETTACPDLAAHLGTSRVYTSTRDADGVFPDGLRGSHGSPSLQSLVEVFHTVSCDSG